MKRFRLKSESKKSNSGIAMFMVMSTLALLSILIAELTYSVQVNSRMAYNSVDNLKAYYLAKAGFKISLLRLRAFVQANNYLNKEGNKDAKNAVGKDLLDKIWNFPFMYPLPTLPGMDTTQKDAINEFKKSSSLTGSFTANITAESSKLNLNNIFVKQIPVEAEGKDKDAQAKSKNTEQQMQEVAFRPLLESVITNALENKKTEEREFSDIYRSIQGTDIVNAIYAYSFKDQPQSNLPGFKMPVPKEAPFYSLTELHLVPGIDDTLYKLIEPLFTVFSTVGINVNTAQKNVFQSLFPEATVEDIAQLMRKRDDPDVGKTWSSDEDFWKTAGEVIASRTVEASKDRLKKAGVKIITEEKSFKISVLATQGQATKRLEAYVVLDAKDSKSASTDAAKNADPNAQQNPSQPNPVAAVNPSTKQDSASSRRASGLNLIYWRVL